LGFLSTFYYDCAKDDDWGDCHPGAFRNGDGYFAPDEGVDETLMVRWIPLIDNVRDDLIKIRDEQFPKLHAASEAHQNAHAAVALKEAEAAAAGVQGGGMDPGELFADNAGFAMDAGGKRLS
jgi:hypothetical protein